MAVLSHSLPSPKIQGDHLNTLDRLILVAGIVTMYVMKRRKKSPHANFPKLYPQDYHEISTVFLPYYVQLHFDLAADCYYW